MDTLPYMNPFVNSLFSLVYLTQIKIGVSFLLQRSQLGNVFPNCLICAKSQRFIKGIVMIFLTSWIEWYVEWSTAFCLKVYNIIHPTNKHFINHTYIICLDRFTFEIKEYLRTLNLDNRHADMNRHYFLINFIRTFWMEGFTGTEPPLSRACVDPARYTRSDRAIPVLGQNLEPKTLCDSP